ncbi:MAG: hypothetical protein ACM30E_02990, partial [Nitrososphaerales archaeon]
MLDDPSPVTPRVEGAAPEGWQRVSLPNFVAPFLAATGGQMLLRAGSSEALWGWLVIAAALALLPMRLRRDVPGRLADAVQISLGFVLSLQVGLNLNNINGQASPSTLIFIWALSCSLVVLAVLNFKPQRIDLHLPAFRLDRWDALALALLLLAAALTRVPALDRFPLGFDPDEGSF